MWELLRRLLGEAFYRPRRKPGQNPDFTTAKGKSRSPRGIEREQARNKKGEKCSDWRHENDRPGGNDPWLDPDSSYERKRQKGVIPLHTDHGPNDDPDDIPWPSFPTKR